MAFLHLTFSNFLVFLHFVPHPTIRLPASFIYSFDGEFGVTLQWIE